MIESGLHASAAANSRYNRDTLHSFQMSNNNDNTINTIPTTGSAIESSIAADHSDVDACTT
jgi:hypothetical protein